MWTFTVLKYNYKWKTDQQTKLIVNLHFRLHRHHPSCQWHDKSFYKNLLPKYILKVKVLWAHPCQGVFHYTWNQLDHIDEFLSNKDFESVCYILPTFAVIITSSTTLAKNFATKWTSIITKEATESSFRNVYQTHGNNYDGKCSHFDVWIYPSNEYRKKVLIIRVCTMREVCKNTTIDLLWISGLYTLPINLIAIKLQNHKGTYTL